MFTNALFSWFFENRSFLRYVLFRELINSELLLLVLLIFLIVGMLELVLSMFLLSMIYVSSLWITLNLQYTRFWYFRSVYRVFSSYLLYSYFFVHSFSTIFDCFWQFSTSFQHFLILFFVFLCILILICFRVERVLGFGCVFTISLTTNVLEIFVCPKMWIQK